jgi:hypothetical protein
MPLLLGTESKENMKGKSISMLSNDTKFLLDWLKSISSMPRGSLLLGRVLGLNLRMVLRRLVSTSLRLEGPMRALQRRQKISGVSSLNNIYSH